MRDAKYIRFQDLHSDLNLSLLPSPVDIVTRVFTRREVAAALDLSEEHLVEFGILCGNDFSSAWYRDDFILPVPCLPHRAPINEILTYVQGWETSFRLQSDKHQLQRAVEFSRDFYELRDLSAYPPDPPCPPSTIPMDLPLDMKAALHSWIDDDLGGGGGRWT